jgi:DNA-binding MarR family transcriptional regulator
VSRAQDAPEYSVDETVSALDEALQLVAAASARTLAHLRATITPTQVRTLMLLHSRNDINLHTLARALAVNSSTALRTVDRLVRAGLAARCENPDDRRQVRLTATGAGLIADLTARRRTAIAQLVERMPASRRAGLVTGLRSLADATEPADAPARGQFASP